ncbi:hypothetical protein ABH999_000681 [Bradyrhizobium yuanmingense]
MDLFSRKIIGWAMQDHMQVELASAALTMAINQQRPQTGLIHHSDRGVQGGFKRSSQHQECGGCDESCKSTFGAVRTGAIAIARPAVCGGTREQNRFWKAIATGQSSEDAALDAELSQPVGSRLFRKAGGMPPAMFRSSGKPLSGRYLSLG